MPWATLNATRAARFATAFPRVSRFIVDQDLGPALAPALQKLGLSTERAFAVNVGHDSSEGSIGDWNERRILLTQDRDFLDDRKFPLVGNAGVVVLAEGHDELLIRALMSALSLVDHGRELWESARIVVSGDGKITVTTYHPDTGARQTAYYKLRLAGPPLVWVRPSLG